MSKSTSITIAFFLLIILGAIMIYLGVFGGPKTLIPPIITGLGFFVIAWAIYHLRR